MGPVDNNLQALSVLDQSSVLALRKANQIQAEMGAQMVEDMRQQSENIRAAEAQRNNPAHLGQNVDVHA